MLDQLESAFNYHQQALGLRQSRHEVLAANIANADTPNYKARDIDFANELKKAVDGGVSQQGSQGGLTLGSDVWTAFGRCRACLARRR